MKTLRILGAVFGTILIATMFSCGGSSYLTEAPIGLWDNDSVVVRFHAVGLQTAPAASNQTGLAKDFFVDDSFAGDGQITGDNLDESIMVDCQFDAPVLSPISGGSAAAIDVVEDDPIACSDPRNCCVYAIDNTWADPCSLTVECVLDAALTDLDNTQMDLSFNIRQHMWTTMRDNGGVVTTYVMEEPETAGAIPTDQAIFTISGATINRDACTGLAASDTFEVRDDNIWDADARDILVHTDMLWNVDSIGLVDIAGGVGDTSECYLYYEDIPGAVSLAPIASSQSVEEYVLIDGVGTICNSQSYTDCGGSPDVLSLMEVDMFNYAEAVTLDQVGIDHICSTTEIATNEGDGCHPTAVESKCVNYAINSTIEAIEVCMDYTNVLSPSIVPEENSAMAEYIRVNDLTTAEACTSADGAWTDIGEGDNLCVPVQITQDSFYSINDVAVGDEIYAVADSYTVENDGVGSDKTTADYLVAIFDNNALETEENLIDLSETCESDVDSEQRALIQNVGFFGDPSVLTAGCLAVWQRFIDDPTVVSPLDRTLNGHFSVDFLNRQTSLAAQFDYLRVFFNDYDINTGHIQDGIMGSISYGEKLVFFDSGWGHEDGVFGAPTVADGLSNITGSQIVYARDGVTYGDMDIEIGWIDQAIDKAGIGDGKNNDFNVKLEMIRDSDGNDCTGFGLWGSVVGSNGPTSSGCVDIPAYNREHAYMGPNSSGFVEEEARMPYLATIIDGGTTAYQLGDVYGETNRPEDWRSPVANPDLNEKTLRDRAGYCMNLGSYRLIAKPYLVNTIDLPTDPSVKNVCKNVAQRFIETTINDGDVGTDKVLTPYPVAIEFENAGTSVQGIKFLIKDGSDPGSSLLEDIATGAYSLGEYAKIPAKPGAPYNTTVDQWFDVDQRVTLQANPRLPIVEGSHGDRLSVYTTGGTADTPAEIDGFIRIATHLDFHRVRESDMHINKPENQYLMFISLHEPVDVNGYPGTSCSFEIEYLIDGECECHLNDTCFDFSWE